jgi:hypothetical protein
MSLQSRYQWGLQNLLLKRHTRLPLMAQFSPGPLPVATEGVAMRFLGTHSPWQEHYKTSHTMATIQSSAVIPLQWFVGHKISVVGCRRNLHKGADSRRQRPRGLLVKVTCHSNFVHISEYQKLQNLNFFFSFSFHHLDVHLPWCCRKL